MNFFIDCRLNREVIDHYDIDSVGTMGTHYAWLG